ncbi:DUF4400 domain-containing protein [Thioalkalivibrio sp. ALE16]|uniref:DUF4400 domain-containing protein n=1 Tax=Thioalkalivibrio sp. ALE16 TaxID=1158172 RepID=UPI00036BF686|nr:DUF4400 domain-containing protein [Thioalkalivibrio sp. ALE16]
MVAKAQAPRQPLSKARFAIAIVLLQTVILFLFDAQGYLSRVVDIERTLNASVMGNESEQVFKDRADDVFFGWVVDSGIYGKARDWTHNAGASLPFASEAGRGNTESEMWKRVEVFWLAFWTMIYRLMLALSWLIVFLPFFAALIYDALNSREKRKWKFEMTSPLKHDTFKKMLVLGVALLIYAPFALIPTPAWAITALVAAVLFLFGSTLRSSQKRV